MSTRQSLAAIHAELRDAHESLTHAERSFEQARLHLQAAQARHRAASLATINACIEIKQISDEAVISTRGGSMRTPFTQGTPS